MSLPPPDWTLELSAAGVSADRPLEVSELQNEIINLFDQFRWPLLRYVFTFGLSAHDAEEIVQEVFLALFRHVQRGRSRRNLRGWMFRVAHNLALKQCYANRRSGFLLEADQEIAARQWDPSPNPEEQMAGSQRVERLQSILRALSPQDQRCLYLRAEGLRYREISAVLGMSLGAVSLSLTKSLARFRRAEQGSEPC